MSEDHPFLANILSKVSRRSKAAPHKSNLKRRLSVSLQTETPVTNTQGQALEEEDDEDREGEEANTGEKWACPFLKIGHTVMLMRLLSMIDILSILQEYQSVYFVYSSSFYLHISHKKRSPPSPPLEPQPLKQRKKKSRTFAVRNYNKWSKRGRHICSLYSFHHCCWRPHNWLSKHAEQSASKSQSSRTERTGSPSGVDIYRCCCTFRKSNGMPFFPVLRRQLELTLHREESNHN